MLRYVGGHFHATFWKNPNGNRPNCARLKSLSPLYSLSRIQYGDDLVKGRVSVFPSVRPSDDVQCCFARNARRQARFLYFGRNYYDLRLLPDVSPLAECGEVAG